MFNNASRWLSGGRASSAPNAKAVELGHRLLEELAVRLVSRRRRRRGGGEKRFQERVRSGGVGGRGASSSND